MTKNLVFAFFFLFLFLSANAQRIAIMGALDQEIAILLDSMQGKKEVHEAGLTFYTGKLKGQKVVVIKSGVGKVNSAYSTALLLNRYKPSKLIFTGVAGGLHPDALPGDLVIGSQLVQFDFGQVDSLGFHVSPFRKLSGGRHEELFVLSDSGLVEAAKKAAGEVDFLSISNRKPMVFTGVIATGDLFVSHRETAERLYSEFEALATEMEGAAVAHICRSLGVPFLVIRSCSDNANQQARVNFNQFVEPAAVNSASLVLKLLKDLE
jgi:adenosylhomocysteine nucleosidase